MQRRLLLKSGGLALFAASAGALPSFLARSVQAAPQPGTFERQKVLVTMFQRFGMDGLMAATPYGDQRLAQLEAELDAALAGLGRAACAHRFGRPVRPASVARAAAAAVSRGQSRDRSCRGLAAQHALAHRGAAVVGVGHARQSQYTDGWLNRALGATATPRDLPLRAVSMTRDRPRISTGASRGRDADIQRARADARSLTGRAPSAVETLKALYRQCRQRGAARCRR